MPLGLGIGLNKSRVLGGGGGYTPAQDPDLFDWWNAQSGITESGGEITAWVGANSETANPPTVTSRPLYGNDQINGLDVLTLRESDPNYLSIDFSTLGSGCTMYIVISFDNLRGNVICDSTSNLRSLRYQSGNSSTAVTFNNLGTSVVFYFNSTTSIGTDITRGALYTAINATSGVLVFENIDFSPITGNCYIGARSDLGENCNGLLGDIIISTGNTNRDENIEFLKSKYNV